MSKPCGGRLRQFTLIQYNTRASLKNIQIQFFTISNTANALPEFPDPRASLHSSPESFLKSIFLDTTIHLPSSITVQFPSQPQVTSVIGFASLFASALEAGTLNRLIKQFESDNALSVTIDVHPPRQRSYVDGMHGILHNDSRHTHDLNRTATSLQRHPVASFPGQSLSANTHLKPRCLRNVRYPSIDS